MCVHRWVCPSGGSPPAYRDGECWCWLSHSHTPLTFLHQHQRTGRLSFPTTFRSFGPSRCLLKLHDNNSCYAALTRQNTLGWHIPSRSCAAQTAIWSNYLARSLFLKLRHSSAESDVADEKKSPRESRVIYIPAEEFSLLHTLITHYTSNLCLALSAEQNVDSLCCGSRAILTFWQDKIRWHQ